MSHQKRRSTRVPLRSAPLTRVCPLPNDPGRMLARKLVMGRRKYTSIRYSENLMYPMTKAELHPSSDSSLHYPTTGRVQARYLYVYLTIPADATEVPRQCCGNVLRPRTSNRSVSVLQDFCWSGHVARPSVRHAKECGQRVGDGLPHGEPVLPFVPRAGLGKDVASWDFLHGRDVGKCVLVLYTYVYDGNPPRYLADDICT